MTRNRNAPSASKLYESVICGAVVGGEIERKRRTSFPCSFSSQTEFASVETCLSPLGFRFLCHLQISWQYIFTGCAKKISSERVREKELQLYHHQSFCLKEYIAIKSRKYAFTLANRAISLPLIQHHILWPGNFPLFIYEAQHFGNRPLHFGLQKLWVGGSESPFLSGFLLHLVATADVLLSSQEQQIKIASFWPFKYAVSHALLWPQPDLQWINGRIC